GRIFCYESGFITKLVTKTVKSGGVTLKQFKFPKVPPRSTPTSASLLSNLDDKMPKGLEKPARVPNLPH
mgnify:CR=1